MSAADIKMFHPYDDFLIAEMLQLEQIGFCGRGEGSQFLLDDRCFVQGQAADQYRRRADFRGPAGTCRRRLKSD